MNKEDCHFLVHSSLARKVLLQVINLPAPEELFVPNVLNQRENTISQNKGDRRTFSTPKKDHLHHIVWIHPQTKLAGNHPFLLDSVELYFRDIIASGAIFTRKFDNSAGCSAVIARINEEIIGNVSYVASVKRRIKNACLTTDTNC